MDRKRTLRIGALVLASFCLIVSVLGWILVSRMRTNLRELRPLVLIHSPHIQRQFDFGEPVTVHATAREQGGVEHIELWVDGELLHAEPAPERAISTLVLHTTWMPETSGRHSLIVRARSAGGVYGQASLNVEVLAEGHPGAEAEIPEGEEGAGQPPMGVEEDRPAGGAAPAPGSDSAPRADPPAPGSAEEVAEWLGLPPGEEAGGEGVPLVLRVEVLALRTYRPYAGLHCYLGAADVPPRWYPDEDDDQTTDESFASLGGGAWDVAASLSGETAPAFAWSTTEPIVLDVTCVGLIDGGREAVEIGRIHETVGPRNWDGITRRLESVDIEGHFTLDYRIAAVGEDAPGIPIALDLGMTPPTNLRLGAWALEWDYEPRPEEEEISGFRIFLNGVLQWTEPADARYSALPYEWISPPCERDYRFYVDAYRGEDWSRQSNTITIRGPEWGSEECERVLVVDIETLETFELPGDEHYANRIGPVTASFFIGEYELFLDGRPESAFGNEMFLYDYDTYSIPDLCLFWCNGSHRVIVNVPPGEDLEIGFDITDHDWRDTDPVCSDRYYILDEEMDRPHTTGAGRMADCVMRIDVRPVFGSPIGQAEGPPPLPMLHVTNLTVDEATGQLEIHVRNNGAATWPGKDLDVVVQWPSGALIGQYTFPELVLRPGETDVLRDPELVPGPHPPLGACVLLDPGNQVPEENDYLPIERTRYCRPLPDLIITDVRLDRDQGDLLVSVQNIGRGSLEDRFLELNLQLPGNAGTLVPMFDWQVSMEPYESAVLVWEGITESVQERFKGGYEVIVDPDNKIAESDGSNNDYAIPASVELRLSLNRARVKDYYGDTARIWFEASIISGRSSRAAVDWYFADPIDWDDCDADCCHSDFGISEFESDYIEIGGDEELVVKIKVCPGPLYQCMEGTDRFNPTNDWGTLTAARTNTCAVYYYQSPGGTHTMRFEENVSVRYYLCIMRRW